MVKSFGVLMKRNFRTVIRTHSVQQLMNIKTDMTVTSKSQIEFVLKCNQNFTQLKTKKKKISQMCDPFLSTRSQRSLFIRIDFCDNFRGFSRKYVERYVHINSTNQLSFGIKDYQHT